MKENLWEASISCLLDLARNSDRTHALTSESAHVREISGHDELLQPQDRSIGLSYPSSHWGYGISVPTGLCSSRGKLASPCPLPSCKTVLALASCRVYLEGIYAPSGVWTVDTRRERERERDRTRPDHQTHARIAKYDVRDCTAEVTGEGKEGRKNRCLDQGAGPCRLPSQAGRGRQG